MRSPVVILGAGHCGLAMSRCLTELSIEHVVLERGEVANSWKKERWSSLRLLTPNWQSKLPGFAYEGASPDGFMSMPEVINFIESYARVIDAPVHTNTVVTSVKRTDAGYDITTNQGTWDARAVVIATGNCNKPVIPKVAAALPPGIHSMTPMDYRSPSEMPDGGVLVVGASATGVQLAYEMQRAGRQVTLAVGEHVRMPRMYRGRDIQWWMHHGGVLDVTYEQVDDIVRARHVPSPQLVGTPERMTLDLNTLTSAGVRLVGRFSDVRGTKGLFSGSLKNVCSLADLKMQRLLTAFDEWAVANGRADELGPIERFEPTRVDDTPRTEMDLGSGEIRTVLWATGFKPDYSWLDVPVIDYKGKLRHTGGVVDSPGMYLMGETFMRRRKSSFIHGAGDDAADLSKHLAAYLG